MTIIDKNYIHEEVKSRLNSGIQFKIFHLPTSSTKTEK
jgi:hypothetical protein